ncbi:MAG TPA: N-acetylglucosamine-6-phosphate deacetylase [Edaphobacter sp.]|nr:N-acetylglucosamine-6-phosphate deacetylase [Edaphobacter sp.]
MSRTLTARLLLTGSGLIEFPVIAIADDGTIAQITSDPRNLAQETSILTAGFLDIHTHGAKGIDVMNASSREFREMQAFLAQHGIAHYLPTTVTAPVDFTLRALDAMADIIEAHEHENEARPVGIHIEGPFLSHLKRGMHPAEYLQPPSVELFERFQAAARGHILLMTIAPEPNALASKTSGEGGISNISFAQSSALELIQYATGRGVRCSIGHTNATATETIAAIEAGAVSATHTFNAMRPLDHREPGVLGTVLDEERLFADLICDGVHVTPPLVRLWLKAKGAARGILITDALSATGMPNGNYIVGDSTVKVFGDRALVVKDLAIGKETLAGSVLTLDRAVANLQRFTGCSLAEASRLASHNPAAMLGSPELTSLSPGSPATLNRFDVGGRLIATYLRGRRIET